MSRIRRIDGVQVERATPFANDNGVGSNARSAASPLLPALSQPTSSLSMVKHLGTLRLVMFQRGDNRLSTGSASPRLSAVWLVQWRDAVEVHARMRASAGTSCTDMSRIHL